MAFRRYVGIGNHHGPCPVNLPFPYRPNPSVTVKAKLAKIALLSVNFFQPQAIFPIGNNFQNDMADSDAVWARAKNAAMRPRLSCLVAEPSFEIPSGR